MHILFYVLFSVTPLILYPKTSELFEFNKMIFVYVITVLISLFWVLKMIKAKKIIFSRTILDIPLLVFLFSQILSTLFSIDPRTSFLGHYSRFNGGLLSTFCYTLLYFAFTSNMDKEKVSKSIYFLLYSSLIVSLIAIFEHFNINITCAFMDQGFSSCWVQDVQNRVFSTLGQPNWLATYLLGLIPLTLYIAIKEDKTKKVLLFLLSGILFTALLFTKSRSGLLGFTVSQIIFWGFAFKLKGKKILSAFIISMSLFSVLFLIINNPLTSRETTKDSTKLQGPALETGGTESGEIRKIVWKGALKIWKNYPILGSGVETFAYSYYKFRPVEHNLISEWDFLYNKAHNEYLNIAATGGTLGLLSYLYLIVSILLVFFKKKKILSISLASGFSGILVANFFGFSTVSTQLGLFLFPALLLSLKKENYVEEKSKNKQTSQIQKLYISIAVLSAVSVLYFIFRYWYADTRFALGKSYNDQTNYASGQKYLQKAVKYSPHEPVFHSEMANSYTGISLSLNELKKKDEAFIFAEMAISESNKAVNLSPANVNFLRSRAGVFLKLSALDPKYLGFVKEALISALDMAPTDAKLLYNLALTYLRTQEIENALNTVVKTIEVKPNYKDARYLYALILIDQEVFDEAKNQLNYILQNIDPNDSNSQNLLKTI